MDVELAVNTFWFLSILSGALYIAKKRYKEKKNFDFINKAFKVSFTFSILLILITLYLLLLM